MENVRFPTADTRRWDLGYVLWSRWPKSLQLLEKESVPISYGHAALLGWPDLPGPATRRTRSERAGTLREDMAAVPSPFSRPELLFPIPVPKETQKLRSKCWLGQPSAAGIYGKVWLTHGGLRGREMPEGRSTRCCRWPTGTQSDQWSGENQSCWEPSSWPSPIPKGMLVLFFFLRQHLTTFSFGIGGPRASSS